jgi:spore germination cell wall hydrolase CwlJ-like protein
LSCDWYLFRGEERAARRPACRRQGDREPRPERRPLPPTYCGVLFQRGQFSFVHGRSLPSAPRSSRQWQTAVAIAKIVDQDLKESAVGNALFFHARYVSPGWHLKRIAAIGNHVFYR